MQVKRELRASAQGGGEKGEEATDSAGGQGGEEPFHGSRFMGGEAWESEPFACSKPKAS